jgi:regulatory protein
MSEEEALSRLMRFCAYRERSHAEVRGKLLDLKIYGEALEAIITELITEGFLNEERYAKAYVRGKFNNNKWGRIKILNGLRAKKVSAYCIKKGLNEIDEEEYNLMLRSLLEKKIGLSTESNRFILIKKVSQYGIQKGYEYDLVKSVITDILKNNKK